MTGTGRITVTAAAVSLILIATGVLATKPASAITQARPLLVVLCKFTDKRDEPHPVSYYEELFGEAGAGKRGVYDYWKDVSYGNITLGGTVVKGWYEVPDTTVEDWRELDRQARLDLCASQAKNDVRFTDFAGVVALTNRTGFTEDLFGAGPPTKIAGTSYDNLGRMLAEEDMFLDGILHEAAHALGVKHSRALSRQAPDSNLSDYGDFYDIGSCRGCYSTPYLGPNGTLPVLQPPGGPGINVVQLETAGWLPADRGFRTFDNTSCNQVTVLMAALNHPDSPGYLEARIPARIPITFPDYPDNPGYTTSSDYYTVELRAKSGWDQGIPDHVTLIHLHGEDSYSYWVDDQSAGTYYASSGPRGGAGSEYVDATRNAYVAVNAIDSSGETAVVTLAACKIEVAMTYSGATAGDFSDTVTLSADLTVVTLVPVPYRPVTLRLGTQSCNATSDLQGRASCQVRIDQHPGFYTASASFAGDPAYESTSANAAFKITKETTATAYTGATTSDYHDAFTASATLTDPDASTPIAGKTIDFELGGGDSCSAVTDTSGSASCSITPNQPAGNYGITARFGGDGDYLFSNGEAQFVITHEQVKLFYDGPAQIANDSPATLRATLKEDGVTPIAGRTIDFTLGSGNSAQSCQGTTGADGQAQCTIASVSQPDSAAMSVAAAAAFAGDAFYLPAGASSTLELLYYTGRSFGASRSLLGSTPAVDADTGPIRTAARSQSPTAAASVRIPLATGTGLDANVVTGDGKSTATAKLTNITIGVLGVSAVRATGVSAKSESTCSGAGGSVTIGSLRVGLVNVNVGNPAPNTKINILGLSIVLNEQKPVPGADHGLKVNALRITFPGGIDYVISSATSDIHNCA